ncbi:tetratricopeptide repeat protein [Sinorhizobium sp. BJ1]|uniref:tetratricopeptide repeat protein n=1 Tax=Sinorhizobium sp. BJ1 TaxID=2035455 RepID=UPI0015CF600C|nr:tetratricopeptide repeat protein [Sinorhizobium sp. BJ1]
MKKTHLIYAFAIALASSIVLTASLTSASEMPKRLAADTSEAFVQQQKAIASFKESADPEARLDYARLLVRGMLKNDHNPLRAADTKAAMQIYRGLVEEGDAAFRDKILRELSKLVLREGTIENEQEVSELRKLVDAAASSKTSRLSPAGSEEVVGDLEQVLRQKMTKGSLDAALELLLLLTRQNSPEADTVRSQMLLMANISVLDGDSSVIKLTDRYAASLDAEQHPEALRSLLELAAGGGSDSVVGLIEDKRELLLKSAGREGIANVIWQLVAAGSTRAAELIALDLVDENVYGFDEADAMWAVSALQEAGSYRTHYLIAKLYYQGIYVAKDLPRATAAMDNMVAQFAKAGQDRLIVADRFSRMNLSDSLAAKYALPIYMEIWKDGKASVIGRIARIIVSAEKGGYYARPDAMPMPAAQLVAELEMAFQLGDASAGFILGDIYREGRLVNADASRAHAIYDELRAELAGDAEMDLKLRVQVAKLMRHELEATMNYPAYYLEVRDLADKQDLWAMKEYGALLVKGGPQLQADPERGFEFLLNALSRGYFSAGPDAADYAFSSGSTEKLEKVASVYSSFDPRLLTPESNIQLAKVVFALKQYDKVEELLNTPEVLALPAGQFLLAEVRLASGALDKAAARDKMRDIIVAFRGDDAALVGFINQLASADDLRPDFIEPVLSRLAELADRGDVDAINAAFKLRQKWPHTQALNFRKVVDWCGTLAERGQGGPLTRVALNANEQAVGRESYEYLIDKVETVLHHLPSNGNLRMFLSRQYMRQDYRSKDLPKANALIAQAAELGNEEALNEIATNYYFGQDVPLDRARAEALYRDLAFMGSNRSSLALARSYSKGPSTRVYESRAFAYYIKAALNGSVTAMTEMGRSYLAGAGAAQDEKKGVAWLEKAASLGDTDAMTQLYYYYFIKNPTNDNPEAERWLDSLVAEDVPEMIVRKAVLLYDRDKEGNRRAVLALLDHAEELGSQFARRLKNMYIKEDRAGVSK